MSKTAFAMLDELNILHEVVLDDPTWHPPGRFTFAQPPELSGTEVAQWTENGWVILPEYPTPEPYKPKQCSPAQGLIALFVLKQITEDDVLQLIDQVADPVQRYTAKIAYGKATFWNRDSANTQMMAGLLNLSEADLDALFSYAVTVEV